MSPTANDKAFRVRVVKSRLGLVNKQQLSESGICVGSLMSRRDLRCHTSRKERNLPPAQKSFNCSRERGGVKAVVFNSRERLLSPSRLHAKAKRLAISSANVPTPLIRVPKFES
jgi:hypothetical protein